MRICYVDEAGSGETLKRSAINIPPVFAISGVVVDANRLGQVTVDFLNLKRRFFPGLGSTKHFLDGVLGEVKGSDLRKDIRSSSRRQRRSAIGFLNEVINLLETHDALILGRVWVKAFDVESDERALYTASIQDMCRHFQSHLEEIDESGFVLCDSRTKSLNTPVAHSVFTRKFRSDGDDLNRIIEMPVFAHSDNHVGLQLADLVVSALLFPMACRAYCAHELTTVHVDPRYDELRVRFGKRLRRLQYRYMDTDGKWRGGIVVSDKLLQKSGAILFDKP